MFNEEDFIDDQYENYDELGKFLDLEADKTKKDESGFELRLKIARETGGIVQFKEKKTRKTKINIIKFRKELNALLQKKPEDITLLRIDGKKTWATPNSPVGQLAQTEEIGNTIEFENCKYIIRKIRRDLINKFLSTFVKHKIKIFPVLEEKMKDHIEEFHLWINGITQTEKSEKEENQTERFFDNWWKGITEADEDDDNKIKRKDEIKAQRREKGKKRDFLVSDSFSERYFKNEKRLIRNKKLTTLNPILGRFFPCLKLPDIYKDYPVKVILRDKNEEIKWQQKYINEILNPKKQTDPEKEDYNVILLDRFKDNFDVFVNNWGSSNMAVRPDTRQMIGAVARDYLGKAKTKPEWDKWLGYNIKKYLTPELYNNFFKELNRVYYQEIKITPSGDNLIAPEHQEETSGEPHAISVNKFYAEKRQRRRIIARDLFRGGFLMGNIKQTLLKHQDFKEIVASCNNPTLGGKMKQLFKSILREGYLMAKTL